MENHETEKSIATNSVPLKSSELGSRTPQIAYSLLFFSLIGS